MVKNICNEMKSFIRDLKENIKDPEDKDPEELKYLLNRTESMFDSIFEEIEKYIEDEEKKISKIKKKQALQEKRMEQIENALDCLDKNVNEIYKDIYEEDMEFEIVCPYCNYKIETIIDEDIKEISCPECNNIIELDWSGDSED